VSPRRAGLLTCTNVSSLLLGLGGALAREVTVRGALGAGRGRLLRQCLTESLRSAWTGWRPGGAGPGRQPGTRGLARPHSSIHTNGLTIECA